MSEYPSRHEDFESNEAFETIVDQLHTDPEFLRVSDEIDDQMDERDVKSLFDQPSETIDPKGAYYVVPVEPDLQQIVDGFHEFCRAINVDPYSSEFTDDELRQISEQVVLEMYTIRQALSPGDTISASEAMLVRPDEDGVEYIGEGRRVQGEVVEAIAWGIPDDVAAMTRHESVDIPLGVGLVIKEPVIIETGGSRDLLSGRPDVVVIALGTLALKVDKHFYQFEHLFITPLDDESSD